MTLLRRPLQTHEILRWADAYRETTGRWPTRISGDIIGSIGETWAMVDTALRAGLRGLPGGSSLARFLEEQRGARNIQNLPPLTETQILIWADRHHEQTGTWPSVSSGIIPGTRGEKWAGIDQALCRGSRGLPGGSTLAQLLARYRGVRNRMALPPLTEEQILAWSDAFRACTGRWPNYGSGPVADAPGETWLAVDMALRHGKRGMPGGSSLALLLAEKRQARNVRSLPDLSVAQILAWADSYHQRTGKWPHLESGPILDAPGETWLAVNHALRRGSRGLPGGGSLAGLLSIERRVRTRLTLPPLNRKQILFWASAHHRRTGCWPTTESGPITESPEDSWAMVDQALRDGTRGLRGGSSLARLLAQYGKKRNLQDLPPLSFKKILAWADRHQEQTGQWPNTRSGPVEGAPGERWDAIDNALRLGLRGLAGGTTLIRLLARKRGVRNPRDLPPLSEAQILSWASNHRQRTGKRPQYRSGPIADAPGETWVAVDNALRVGRRGLPGGSSLARLLAEQLG